MRTRLGPAAHVGPLGRGALAEDGPPVQRPVIQAVCRPQGPWAPHTRLSALGVRTVSWLC